MAGQGFPKASLLHGRFAYLLLGLLCAVVSLLLGWSSFANRINASFYDLYFRQRGPRPHGSNIVIVGIDDATLARYGSLPLDRSVLGQGIRVIRQAHPRLIALDLLLPDVSQEGSDGNLELALAGEGSVNVPVVLATALDVGTGVGWLDPLPRFARNAAAIGHAHADPDADGVSRRALLAKQADHRRYWALALECFRILQGASREPVTETDDFLEVPASLGFGFGASAEAAPVPASRAGQRAILINYAGGEGTFSHISFVRLLEDAELRRQLQDKIVLLGVTAQGTGDRLFTPFSSGLGMAGVEIHGHILNTLLSGEYLRPAGELDLLLAVLVITAITGWLLVRFQGPLLFVLLLGLTVTILAGPYGLFLQGEVWPGFSPLLSFGTALGVFGTHQLLLTRRRFAESETRRRRSQQQFEMATHEIRTPLAAIQGSSELLARYPLDDSRREQILRLIYEESHRLGKLVERFLSVERLSAGEVELRRSPVNLSLLLEATAERLRPVAERKGILLTREDNAAETVIDADPELLEFAFSNLLTNAVKYSPAGASVKFALQCEGAQVQIHVSDSGPGLTPQESRRVFDRFFRTRTASESEAPGFGLGLAIAREIARHHGGDLRLETKPGVGSRFTISLPAKAPTGKQKQMAG